MRDPPSGRVPEQGPDWFLVATEASGGGTPDLGYFLEVSVFIRPDGIENKLGGPTRESRAPRRAQGGVRASLSHGFLVAPPAYTPSLLDCFHSKISSVKFQVNWTPFDFPFLRYSKTRKKQKLALGSRLIG